jgi:hypothetical protein
MPAGGDPNVARLRAELAKEVDAGFPHLSRIPATKVVQFIDYVDDLDAGHRVTLLDDLARGAARYVARDGGRESSVAIDRMRAAMRGPGEFVGAGATPTCASSPPCRRSPSSAAWKPG